MIMATATLPHYISLYGLKQAPFRLSPDPYFFFPAPTHLAAEKILSHAIANGEGFMVLTGQAGLGKTLLLRRLVDSLDDNKLPLLILSPAVDPLGLLRLLLAEIETPFSQDSDLSQLLQIFQDRLFQFTGQGKELLIIIDEAQNMPVETVEQLRMLSNFETGSRKLLQILLVGQLELETLLADPRLGQLAQRIIVHERLSPFSPDETRRYIQFRLERAGRSDIQLGRGGMRCLYRASGGIPRLINKIMDRTLLLASADRSRILKKKYVQDAIGTMQINPSETGTGTTSRFWPAVTVILAILLAVLLVMTGQRSGFFSRNQATTRTVASTQAHSPRSQPRTTSSPPRKKQQTRLTIHQISISEKKPSRTGEEVSHGR